MKSRVWQGWVRHRRHAPIAHAFRYRIAMVGLDLDEAPALLRRSPWFAWRRPALARFHRGDYLAGVDNLAQAARNRVVAAGHAEPTGRVELISHLRYAGYCFNPVTFYRCHDAADRPVAIVAEITNTPWKERHAYVCHRDAAEDGAWHFRFRKDFHVSPFMPMDQCYDWRFRIDDRSLWIHMINEDQGQAVFDATMSAQGAPATPARLRRMLLTHPLMTWQVIVGIYRQAAALHRRGAPFHAHPRKAGVQEVA